LRRGVLPSSALRALRALIAAAGKTPQNQQATNLQKQCCTIIRPPRRPPFSGLLASTSVSSGFRHPLGDGNSWTESNDGDGHYVYSGQKFNDLVTFSNGNKAYHLGEDRNAEGRDDLGDPVYAASNGEVVAVVSNQGSSTTGFGNCVVIRHDLPHAELINGKMVGSVYSLYAHLATVGVSEGEIVSIGYQVGTIGDSGYSEGPHLHFEIALAPTLPTSDDGYNPLGAPDKWVDPSDFINQHRTLGSTHSVLISDAQISEGNSGTQTMTFTVTRVGGTEAFDVSYATADGTASVTDGDYLATSGTLHFDTNVNTQTISVTINGDTTNSVYPPTRTRLKAILVTQHIYIFCGWGDR